MEEVTHARTVRIGPAHKCGVFEADGFVYATILGKGVPSRSRPANKQTHMHVSNNNMLGGEDHGLEGVGLPSAACQRSQRSRCEQTSTMSNTARGNVSADVGAGGCAPNYRMVSGDKHEPPLRNLRERKGVVYLITCNANGKQYVGQTLRSATRRMREHALGRRGKGSCTALARAIKKYGWNAFAWRIIAHDVPESQINSMEIEMVSKHGTRSPAGYNLDGGGWAMGSRSDEFKARHSVAMKLWASNEAVRKRKRDVWASPGYKAARCAERKVLQNKPENVAARHVAWDAKARARLAQVKEERKRREFVLKARNRARQGVHAALRRGVQRDVWQEFYARWLSDKEWKRWRLSGSCSPPRGCPLHTAQQTTR